MSSSEQGSARRFFAGVTIGLAAASALFAALMLTVDPLGATDGNRLCPAGAKVLDARITRTLVAERLRPRTIVLGTSRVRVGFDGRALAELGPGPVANLGTSAALPADFAALGIDAHAGGRLARVFIGVDFNALHQQDYTTARPPLAEARFPLIERWRRAFLSHEALAALPQALDGCSAQLGGDGVPNAVLPDGPRQSPAANDSERKQLAWQLRKSDWDRARFAARMAELRALIVELRGRDVEVVVFSAPYQENLLALFDKIGREGEFERFHADVAQLARETGVPFVDLHSPAAIQSLQLPPCASGGIACHYADLTHYSPLVGEQIARVLAAEAGSARR